jgi:histone-lysine N-methyltransferase SETD3
MHQHVELLSLECAFEWLRLNYPEISIPLVKAIAEDQEEPLPLNWAVLVEDWDHTYWVVWIYTIWLLWARDGDEFRTRHEDLWSWMVRMNEYVMPTNHLCLQDHRD